MPYIKTVLSQEILTIFSHILLFPAKEKALSFIKTKLRQSTKRGILTAKVEAPRFLIS